MFEFFGRLVKWFFQAAITYAASEEGGTELQAILNEAEADGIDIPFYEPSSPQGNEGVSGRQNEGLSGDDLYAKTHQYDDFNQ